MRPFSEGAAVTLRQVAERAGVSLSTTSRILNGTRTIRDDADAAVRSASDELGYRPNLIARSLRGRSTKTIAMLVPGISNPFFPQLVEAVMWALEDSDRVLVLADSRGDPQIQERQIRALIDRQVDGIIIVPCDHGTDNGVRYAAMRIPTVQLDRHIDVPAGHVVGLDNAAAMGMVVDHLVGGGRRRLALISGDERSSAGAERISAYQRAVQSAGIEGADRAILGRFDVRTGAEGAHQLLGSHDPPDAIICGADVIALGVLESARKRGVSVPSELAVTGFDDIELARVVAPGLTTIRQPIDALASTSLRLLDEDPRPFRHVSLVPELMVRSSCGGQ